MPRQRLVQAGSTAPEQPRTDREAAARTAVPSPLASCARRGPAPPAASTGQPRAHATGLASPRVGPTEWQTCVTGAKRLERGQLFVGAALDYQRDDLFGPPQARPDSPPNRCCRTCRGTAATVGTHQFPRFSAAMIVICGPVSPLASIRALREPRCLRATELYQRRRGSSPS